MNSKLSFVNHKQMGFMEMLKKKGEYIIRSLDRIEIDLKKKHQKNFRNNKENQIEFVHQLRQIISMHQIIINQIKADFVMSQLQNVGEGIQKIFTQLASIINFLIKMVLKNQLLKPNSKQMPHEETIPQKNKEQLNKQFFKSIELMKYDIGQLLRLEKQNKNHAYESIWNLLNKDLQRQIYFCNQIQPNQNSKIISQVYNYILGNKYYTDKFISSISSKIKDTQQSLAFQIQSKQLYENHKKYILTIVSVMARLIHRLRYLENKTTKVSVETNTDCLDQMNDEEYKKLLQQQKIKIRSLTRYSSQQLKKNLIQVKQWKSKCQQYRSKIQQNQQKINILEMAIKQMNSHQQDMENLYFNSLHIKNFSKEKWIRILKIAQEDQLKDNLQQQNINNRINKKIMNTISNMKQRSNKWQIQHSSQNTTKKNSIRINQNKSKNQQKNDKRKRVSNLSQKSRKFTKIENYDQNANNSDRQIIQKPINNQYIIRRQYPQHRSKTKKFSLFAGIKGENRFINQLPEEKLNSMKNLYDEKQLKKECRFDGGVINLTVRMDQTDQKINNNNKYSNNNNNTNNNEPPKELQTFKKLKKVKKQINIINKKPGITSMKGLFQPLVQNQRQLAFNNIIKDCLKKKISILSDQSKQNLN